MVPSRWSSCLDPQLWARSVVLHWPVEWCALGFSSRNTWIRINRHMLARPHDLPHLYYPELLISLQLGLDCLDSGQPTERFDLILGTVNRAINLQMLSIGSAAAIGDMEDPSTSPLTLFTSRLSSSSLQFLEVIGFFATAQQYITLFATAGDALKHLRLQRLTLPEDECWTEVLKHLATSHELATFDASYLYRGGDSTYLCSRSDLHQMYFQGKRKTVS